MSDQFVLIIGEVFVDTHLDIVRCGIPATRLGGIFHAARAFSAVGIQYALAYYAPNYLDTDIKFYSKFLNCRGCYKLGDINAAPNVMLIQDSPETGDQGYINILSDQTVYCDVSSLAKIIDSVHPSDVLLFPGRFNAEHVMNDLNEFPGKLHIDINYDSNTFLSLTSRAIDTLFLSTSSYLFQNECAGTLYGVVEHFNSYTVKCFLLKENRGGSICFYPEVKKNIQSPAFYAHTVHSVGVGDVYDSLFLCDLPIGDSEEKMIFSALCAAKYAETLDYDDFKETIKLIIDNFDDFKGLRGIRLPWSRRKDINIYLAAPDFPDVDTTLLDKLYNDLKYHNFSPRRPIKENGLSCSNTSRADELELYQKDLLLLNECSILIALLLYNDPGTFVELGMFKQAGKPTILFDPFNICSNMFAKNTPDYICNTLSDVIDTVYLCLGDRNEDL